LCQAAFAWEATQVIRGLTQGQVAKFVGRETSVVKMFFPLFAAAPQAFGLPWRHRLNVAQAAKPALLVARRRVFVFFTNQARLGLVSRLGSLRYVRAA
jgi:hypothetical protein